MSRRETVVFRNDDDWLAECIDKILTVKRTAGIKSSFSYELVRLAKNGLVGSMSGAESDRKALKEGKL